MFYQGVIWQGSEYTYFQLEWNTSHPSAINITVLENLLFYVAILSKYHNEMDVFVANNTNGFKMV